MPADECWLAPHATLHTAKFTEGELPGASDLEMWMKEKRSASHLLETADWEEASSCLLRRSLPSHPKDARQSRDHPGERERNRVRFCSDWQKDWLHPISCCLQMCPAPSLDNGMLLPKPFEKETACFQPDFIPAMFSWIADSHYSS